MATGDVTVFDATFEAAIQDWAGTDNLKCAILDNTTAPLATTATPVLADFTEVGSAGSYEGTGGQALGTLADFVSFSGGTTTFDSTTNPTWAQNGSNDTDAYWGYVHNDTTASALADGFAFVDLGGPVDMSAGQLTITWNASGLATIA